MARNWNVRSAGPGTRVLRWTPEPGDWAVVVMNADGSAGVAVRASAGIAAPFLLQFGITMVLAGLGVGLLALGLLVVPVRLARVTRTTSAGRPAPPSQ